MDNKALETLKQVRAALKEVDCLRTDKDIDEEQRAALELSAVELRKVERALIDGAQDQLVSDLRSAAENLGRLSSRMRASLKKFNTTARVLSRIDHVTGYVTSVISAISEWL